MKKFVSYFLIGLALLVAAAAIHPAMLRGLLSSNYLPHRYCYLVTPWLVWTNAISDALIFLSYAGLFYGLFWLAARVRHELRSYLWVFLAFGTFILACGLTHLMEVITVWRPMYPLAAAIKVICVLASVPTAVAFLIYVPPMANQIRQILLDLQSSKKALISSERLAAVGRISASISHEINNPLESVMNLLHMIKTHPGLPPELVETTQLTEQEIARVAAIANNTLKLYRESASQVRVDMGEVVEQILALERAKLLRHNVEVQLRRPEEGVEGSHVMAHPGEVRQVLLNMIENAIAAMPQGGTLRVTLLASAIGENPGVVVRVADTGVGIPEELLSNLFDPFFTTKGEKGTGLGLWVVRQIVEKHGGLLTVRSTVGKGTVFAMWLPANGPGTGVGELGYPVEMEGAEDLPV